MNSEETTPDLEKRHGISWIYSRNLPFRRFFPCSEFRNAFLGESARKTTLYIMNMSQYPTTQTHLRGWWYEYITSHHESSMTPVKWKKYDFEQMTFASQLVQHFQTNP